MLFGARELIAKNRPHLFLEIHPGEKYTKILNLMEEWGYRLGENYGPTCSKVYHFIPLETSMCVEKKLITFENSGSYDDWLVEDYNKFFDANLMRRDQWYALPSGVDATQRAEDPIMISFTTYPKRTNEGTNGKVWLTIETLLQQTLKPQRIVLNLSREEYPEGLSMLPQTILDQMERGLEICIDDGNRKAAKKLLPQLHESGKYTIVTVDDDALYPKKWLENLVNHHDKYPFSIITNASRLIAVEKGKLNPYKLWPYQNCERPISNMNLILGGWGCLYPIAGKGLNGLHERVLDPDFEDIYTTNDDLWFWACAVLQKTPIRVLGKFSHSWMRAISKSESALCRANLKGRNDEKMCEILARIPILKDAIGLR